MSKEVIRKTSPEVVNTPAVNSAPKRFIKLPEAMKKTGKGRASIYADMAAGRFPQSIKLGERSIAWLESEIDTWMDSRISASRS